VRTSAPSQSGAGGVTDRDDLVVLDEDRARRRRRTSTGIVSSAWVFPIYFIASGLNS
jgi:hypothetical protein